MSTWFGSLDLAWKFGLVFGAALVAVLVVATTVRFLTRRRLRKIVERQGGLIQLPVEEETALNVRQKDAGDLFGIRAIEAGFYGGVFQAPRPNPLGAPSYTIEPEAPTSWRPESRELVKVADSSVRPLFFIKPVDGTSNTVAAAPPVNVETRKVTTRRPDYVATGQQFRGQRFPVATRQLTRPQSSEIRPEHSISRIYEAYKPYKPTSPLAVTEAQSYPVSHVEASNSRSVLSNNANQTSRFSATESDPTSHHSDRSSAGSDLSRLSSDSSHTSVSSIKTVRDLSTPPSKSAVARVSNVSNTDMATPLPTGLIASHSSRGNGLTKAQKQLARRSSSTVGAMLEDHLTPRQSCLHSNYDIEKMNQQAPRRESYSYDLEELVDDDDEDFTMEFDPELEPESILDSNPRWSYLKPISPRGLEFGFKARPKDIVIPLREIKKPSTAITPKSPAKQVTFMPTAVAYMPRAAQKDQVFTGNF